MRAGGENSSPEWKGRFTFRNGSRKRRTLGNATLGMGWRWGKEWISAHVTRASIREEKKQ